MKSDKWLAASRYLIYRTLYDRRCGFVDGRCPRIADASFPRQEIYDSFQLMEWLKDEVRRATQEGTAALMLSGGIDSAILARFMPKGSVVYTLKCIVPGVEVTDETAMAARYAQACGLEQRVVSVYWEDYEALASLLMRHKGAPIHSIEVQIHKAALRAKKDGFSKLIFGENADIIYGGMDGLLAKDWTFGDFVERYTYVMPYKVLRNPVLDLSLFLQHEKNGHIDGHEFVNDVFRAEALGSYHNACEMAGIEFCGPFSTSRMATPIDYARIRSGDTKYLVREVFRTLYPGWGMPKKIPMPRPMNEWMKSWNGPIRPEFWPDCVTSLLGDQKWMVWALERFLGDLEDSLNEQS